MKDGIAKSYALDKIQKVVTETLADAYAQLRSVSQNYIRKDDLLKDTMYLLERSSSEGLEFFTIQLPRLGDWYDDFLVGLPVERVEGFKPYNGLLPVFLRPFWRYTEEVLVPIMVASNNQTELTSEQAKLVRLIRTLLHGLKKLVIETRTGGKG